MKQIRIITPTIANNYRSIKDFDFLNTSSIKISHSFIDNGPKFISSVEEHDAAIPGTINKIDQAVSEGVDAIIIDCMGDTAIQETSGKYDLPIIGPTFSSFKMANIISNKVGILALAEVLIPEFQKMRKLYGFASEKLSAISLTETNLDMLNNHDTIMHNVTQQCLNLIDQDQIDTIILGCTLFSKDIDKIRNSIINHAPDINVIDPITSAFDLARSLIDP